MGRDRRLGFLRGRHTFVSRWLLAEVLGPPGGLAAGRLRIGHGPMDRLRALREGARRGH